MEIKEIIIVENFENYQIIIILLQNLKKEEFLFYKNLWK